jgi:hypothetical protein
MGILGCLQRWCTIDKLDELRCIEYDLIEEDCYQVRKGPGVEPDVGFPGQVEIEANGTRAKVFRG